MALYESREPAGQAVDFQDVINDLNLGPPQWGLLCDAIHCGDELPEDSLLLLKGPLTLAPKREAILSRRPDVLRVLLQRDNYIEESIVALACEQKDYECIQELLNFGWPIDKPVYFAASLLCLAVNDLPLMQWLVEKKGANVNAKSSMDEPTLSLAIVHGRMDVVRFLLEKGTDVTCGNLLHCAAQRTNQAEGAEIVFDLVGRGADANAWRFYNSAALQFRGFRKLPTPLHVACEYQNIPVARALLRHKADPHRKMIQAGQLTGPTPLEQMLERKERREEGREEEGERKDQELINLLSTTEYSA